MTIVDGNEWCEDMGWFVMDKMIVSWLDVCATKILVYNFSWNTLQLGRYYVGLAMNDDSIQSLSFYIFTWHLHSVHDSHARLRYRHGVFRWKGTAIFWNNFCRYREHGWDEGSKWKHCEKCKWCLWYLWYLRKEEVAGKVSSTIYIFIFGNWPFWLNTPWALHYRRASKSIRHLVFMENT